MRKSTEFVDLYRTHLEYSHWVDWRAWRANGQRTLGIAIKMRIKYLRCILGWKCNPMNPLVIDRATVLFYYFTHLTSGWARRSVGVSLKNWRQATRKLPCEYVIDVAGPSKWDMVYRWAVWWINTEYATEPYKNNTIFRNRPWINIMLYWHQILQYLFALKVIQTNAIRTVIFSNVREAGL